MENFKNSLQPNRFHQLTSKASSRPPHKPRALFGRREGKPPLNNSPQGGREVPSVWGSERVSFGWRQLPRGAALRRGQLTRVCSLLGATLAGRGRVASAERVGRAGGSGARPPASRRCHTARPAFRCGAEPVTRARLAVRLTCAALHPWAWLPWGGVVYGGAQSAKREARRWQSAATLPSE